MITKVKCRTKNVSSIRSDDTNEDNSLVTSGFFSPDLGVDDSDRESDVSAEDGKMSELAL